MDQKNFTMEESDQSLVEFLTEQFPCYSVRSLRKFIEQGGAFVDQRKVSPAENLKKGSLVEIVRPLPKPDYHPKRIPFEVLYEDDWILVLSKPPGIPVIPMRDNTPTLVDGILHYLKAKSRPRIIHRLDRFTSGVMVIGKKKIAASELSKDFLERNIKKNYLAFVQGTPYPEEGEIKKNIVDLGTKKSKSALTHYKILETFSIGSLLSITPHTGRMHQIRIHLSGIGHPLLIDPKYQGKTEIFLSEFKRGYRRKENRSERPIINRLTLHAHELTFNHPKTKEELTFTAPLFKDLQRLYKILKKYG